MKNSSPKTNHNPLMFITPNRIVAEVERLVLGYLQGGGRWVQLRLKDVPEVIVYETGKKIQKLCQEYGATFIVNDYPEIALELGADGVHLGKLDKPVDEARKIVGCEKIIGGTANTLEDMIALASKGVDYIGVGPYSFTTTKKNLSPVVGLDGYRSLLQKFRSLGFNTPVTAIGGVLLSDVEEIMATGVDGIAVSGALAQSEDLPAVTLAFLGSLDKKTKAQSVL